MILFIYCAGGYGKESYDVAKRANTAREQWDTIYFADDTMVSGSDFYGTKVYTFTDLLAKFVAKDIEFIIANGEPVHRAAIYNKLHKHGMRLGRAIDPSAVVGDICALNAGALMAPHCSVVSDAKLGLNVAINTQAIVSHDVKVGDHTVISSQVNIGGACVIGERSFIGMGVLIKEGITIGNEVIIGMGSVVYSDIPDGMIAMGNPARPMRRNVDKLVFKTS
jgi:sugar O-acyltransferase (sialic acid O-acetyltransferase NeuD family)